MNLNMARATRYYEGLHERVASRDNLALMFQLLTFIKTGITIKFQRSLPDTALDYEPRTEGFFYGTNYLTR